MPRDSNGNFSLIPSYLAVTGQTIETSQYNPVVEDIAAALTGSVPRNGAAPMLANLPMGGFKITGVANGSASSDAATKAQVDAATPVGCVMDWAGTVAPTGWLLCYGQAVSRTDYAALFAICQTTYGAGDGTTTFNVPDLRAVVVAGRADMGGTLRPLLNEFASTTLGASFGAQTYTLSAAQIPQLSGVTGTDGAHAHNYGVGLGSAIDATAGSNGFYATLGPSTTDSRGAHSHNVTVNAGGGGAHNNTQPTVILNKIIKAL